MLKICYFAMVCDRLRFPADEPRMHEIMEGFNCILTMGIRERFARQFVLWKLAFG